MQRYLITGGCGFIGSHLADALLGAGHAVRVLDDLSTGKRSNLSSEAELIEGDLCDPAALDAAVQDVDGAFHLAAIASVRQCIEEWSKSSTVNLLGSVALFERMAALSKPVVYASSAAIYGDCAPPCRRDQKASPLSAYGSDKYSMELHSAAAAITHDLRSFGVRFFNIYGPRQDAKSPYSGVIAIFMDRILKGQPITIFGDGTQTRDFVYVRDAVRALHVAMEDLEASNAPRAEVENVGTGAGVDLLELANSISRVAGKPLEIRHEAPRDGDIRYSYSEPSAKLKFLGAEAVTPLEEGLRHLIRSVEA